METVRTISTMSTAAMRIQGLMILYLQKHIREKYTGDEKVLLFTGESVTKRCHSTDKTVVFARRMLYNYRLYALHISERKHK